MKVNIAELPKGLQDYIKSIEEEKNRWKERYEHSLQELQILLHKRFGKSSERFCYDDKQLSMLIFDECEQIHKAAFEEEPEQEKIKIPVKGHSRKKPRKAIPDNIPEVTIYHDIKEEDKECGCGTTRTVVKTIKTKKLGYTPERHYAEVHVRLVYGCKNCEGSGDEDKPALLTAPIENSIIPKSIATPSLIAGIFTNKYCDHLPYYRQAQRFFRNGIQISRQDMSNWQKKVYEPAVKPLVELLNEYIRSWDFIQMDETFTRVMNEPGKKNTSKSYAWVARGGPPDKPAVTYTYQDNRSHKHPKEFLQGFRGYLQTDGYSAYETAIRDYNSILLVGCFAHARRKFHDTWIASKKKSKRAAIGINYIKKICKIEKVLREKELEDSVFLKERKKEVQPVLDELESWCQEEQLKTPPDSNLGKAFGYTLNQWDKLVLYLEHPMITPTNNLAENSVRPYVLGRKNWLHNGSPQGAIASCGLISLIESAKLNNLNPYIYLYYIFTEIPKRKPDADLNDLLPMNIDHEKLKIFIANQIPNRFD